MKNYTNVSGLRPLSKKEQIETTGGYFAIAVGVMAGLFYCYEFGYNYAKERLAR